MALPIKKPLRISLILTLLFFSVFTLPFGLSAGPHLWVSLEIQGKNCVFIGESVTIHQTSNASQVLIHIYNASNTLIYTQNHNANSSFNYSPTSGYGKYTVKALTDTSTSETWFWVQNDNSLTPFSVPYSWTYQNILYTLHANYTVSAMVEGKYLLVDWLSEIFTKLKPTVTTYRNNYGLIVVVTNGKDITCESYLMNTCFGLKFRMIGTLKAPVTLKWNFKATNAIIGWMVDALYLKTSKCNLVYEYGSLTSRSTGCNYAIDKTGLKLNIYLSTNFDIDPAIFEDGFETGDYSRWSNEIGDNVIVETPVHHGTYSSRGNGTGLAYYSYATTGSDVYFRGCFYFPSLPPTSTQKRLLEIQDTLYSKQTWACVGKTSGGKTEWLLYTSNSGWTEVLTSININEWYCVELRFKTGNGDGIATMWVNGTQIATKTTEVFIDNAKYFYGGIEGAANFIVYSDCFLIDSSYIGPEANSFPISCSQGIGTSWIVSETWLATVPISQSVHVDSLVSETFASLVAVTQGVLVTSLASVNSVFDVALSQLIGYVSSVSLASAFTVGSNQAIGFALSASVILNFMVYTVNLIIGIFASSSVAVNLMNLESISGIASIGFILAIVALTIGLLALSQRD